MRDTSKALTVLLLATLGYSGLAQAENYPANKCQIFIKNLTARPSSHGSASMGVVVKTSWIGGGELVKKVGFWGRLEVTDLGNRASCGTPYTSTGMQVFPANGGIEGLVFGEYRFTFPIRSGSVISECPGYRYASIGTFFIETDKNTYWLNPDMDPNKLFYFDSNALDILESKTGSYFGLPTDREDMRYYNPGQCRQN